MVNRPNEKDQINNGQLEKGKSKPSIKKTYGGGVATSKAPSHMNVRAIIPQQPLAYPNFTKKDCREFSNLGMTLCLSIWEHNFQKIH